MSWEKWDEEHKKGSSSYEEVSKAKDSASLAQKALKEEKEKSEEKDIFHRLSKGKEHVSPTEKNKAFQGMPEKEGYKKVFKPYGEKGRGFYYSKSE